jgi:hypothetical protein
MTVTSVHVLSSHGDQTWDDLRALRPDRATYWHPGVWATPDASGLPVPDLRSWTVLATWDDRADWEAALDGPGPWQDTAEAWSALLVAGPTRDLPAAARWAEGRSDPPFGSPTRTAPAGPTAVVTTVGLSPDDLGAVLRFIADVQHVVRTLADTPGSLGYRLASAEHFPSQVDAFTFSLWSSARAARAWAYSAGVHARAMDDHMDGGHVLRGSFTTFDVVDTRGTWTTRHRLATPVAAG